MSLKFVSTYQLGRKLQIMCNNQNKILLCRNMSSKFNSQNQNKPNTNKIGDTKKQQSTPKITLFGPNNSMSITSLEDALKLSKRRDLKLVKVKDEDSKSQRPIYKLLSAADLLAEESSGSNSKYQSVKDTKESDTKKSEKSLTIGSRIADHDLSSRIKNIVKWLQKRHEVRILIQGAAGDPQNSDKVFEKIESSINNPDVSAKIVQRRQKNGNTKFSIIPSDGKNPKPL